MELTEGEPAKGRQEDRLGEANLPTGKAVVDSTVAKEEQQLRIGVRVVVGGEVLGDGLGGDHRRLVITLLITILGSGGDQVPGRLHQALPAGGEGEKGHLEVLLLQVIVVRNGSGGNSQLLLKAVSEFRKG